MIVVKDVCHLAVSGIDCILVRTNEKVYLYPKNLDNLRGLYDSIGEEDELFSYVSYHGSGGLADTWCSICIREKQIDGAGYVCLIPKYLVCDYCINGFAGFEVTGDAIDDFFNPAHYYYFRDQSDSCGAVDLKYESEVVESWSVDLDGKPVTITLSFGEILLNGVGSDLKLHPKLSVVFEDAPDISSLFSAYNLIVRFLQLTRYNRYFGNLRVRLFNTVDGKRSYLGRLYGFLPGTERFYKSLHVVGCEFYLRYVGLFLRIVAADSAFSTSYYPGESFRYRGCDYSPANLVDIFGAFEQECVKAKGLYSAPDDSGYRAIKDDVLDAITNLSSSRFLSVEETRFLENAQNSIERLGTQVGQTQKIVNAYFVLQKAIDSSIHAIFTHSIPNLSVPLSDGDIRGIAKRLSKLRGKAAHGSGAESFSDCDADCIRFLEVIVYAQLAKRAGFSDVEIEYLIGVVFECNPLAYLKLVNGDMGISLGSYSVKDE